MPRPTKPWRRPPCLASKPLRTALMNRGSLTAWLKANYPDFKVKLLRQAQASPYRDELLPLGLPKSTVALRREVLLMSGNTPLVYASSATTFASLRGPFRMLKQQGTRPLGATLFANPKVQRGKLSLARMDARHHLWRAADKACGPLPAGLWARRSCFRLGHARLLVTELFLTKLMEDLQ